MAQDYKHAIMPHSVALMMALRRVIDTLKKDKRPSLFDLKIDTPHKESRRFNISVVSRSEKSITLRVEGFWACQATIDIYSPGEGPRVRVVHSCKNGAYEEFIISPKQIFSAALYTIKRGGKAFSGTISNETFAQIKGDDGYYDARVEGER